MEAVCPEVLDETEREQEAEVNLDLVAEELMCQAAGAEAVTETAEWLKRTCSDPRSGPSSGRRRGPKVKLDTRAIRIATKPTAHLELEDLGARQSFPAQLLRGGVVTSGQAVGIELVDGVVMVFFVALERFAGADPLAGEAQDHRWLP